MRLSTLTNGLLAVVDVETDTAEPWGECFKRKVVARMRESDPVWDGFIPAWRLIGRKPHEDDGKSLIAVRGLQVDHDLYGFYSWLNVEGNTIRLILLERFTGTVDEYHQEVRKRNQRVEDYLGRWDRFEVTRNDLRQLLDLEPIDEPLFNEPLPADAIRQARDVFLRPGNVLTHNTIV